MNAAFGSWLRQTLTLAMLLLGLLITDLLVGVCPRATQFNRLAYAANLSFEVQPTVIRPTVDPGIGWLAETIPQSHQLAPSQIDLSPVSGTLRLQNVAVSDSTLGLADAAGAADGPSQQPSLSPNRSAEHWATDVQTHIQADKNDLDVNRGGIVGVNGISLPNLDGLDLEPDGIRIDGSQSKYRANRGAVAGVSGIGIGGIGSLAFAGGGGIGGIGNAGNGGDGGQGGEDGGNGGQGGQGGDGGTGLFRSLNVWDNQGGIGAAVFSGGSGFGGIGNAGNGGQGGDAKAPTANGGAGGSGGAGGDGRFGDGWQQSPLQAAQVQLAGVSPLGKRQFGKQRNAP